MSIFVITYDLNNEEKDYTKLTDELKRLGCHRAARSFWLCNLNETTEDLLEHFKNFIDKDDTLIVVRTNIDQIEAFKPLKGTFDWIKNN